MEFPTKPTRKQRRNQQEVSAVIAGMQDTCLEPSPDRLDEILAREYAVGAIVFYGLEGVEVVT